MKNKSIKIISNGSYAKILTEDITVLKEIYNLLSFYVLNYENSFRYKNKTWDGKSSLFDLKNNIFPSGYLYDVDKKLRDLGFDVTHARKPLLKPLGVRVKNLLNYKYDERYSYQNDCVDLLLKRGNYVCRVATGGGKTAIMAYCCIALQRKTLILTTKTSLMNQIYKMLSSQNLDVGLVNAKEKNFDRQITIAMTKSLKNYCDKNDDGITFLKSIEFLIGEEAHEISGDNYYELAMMCNNAQYRIGFTATPFMKNDTENNMKLIGCFGNLGINISEKKLIDLGILAKPTFVFRKYQPETYLKWGHEYAKAVDYGIVKDKGRNDKILEEALNGYKAGLNVLILVQRVEHGNALLYALKRSGAVKTRYLSGKVSDDKRDDIIAAFNRGNIRILIGTTVLDVGVDMPGVNLLILAGGGKAEVGYRQRIGRGLRSKKKINQCYVIDFFDEQNKYLQEHSIERMNMIKNTPGFRDNLLDSDAPLDYGVFCKAPKPLWIKSEDDRS